MSATALIPTSHISHVCVHFRRSLLSQQDSPETGIELDTLDGEDSSPNAGARQTAGGSGSRQGGGQSASAPAFAIGGEEDEEEVGEQGSFIGSDHLATSRQPGS